MSNPNVAPKEPSALQLALAIAPDAFLEPSYQALSKSYKDIGAAQAMLEPLDMEMRKTFEIPREYIWDPATAMRDARTYAKAANGVPKGRVRSDVAKSLVNSAYAELPGDGIFSKERVGSAMAKRVYIVDAGTNATLGRLKHAYPKVGSRIERPVTPLEARRALQNCGLDMSRLTALPDALRPYPLLPREDGYGIMVNPHADNGFPVMGKWNSGEGAAAQKVMGLAISIRRELERAHSIGAWKREAEEKRPYLVALMGKAKADYYAQEKVTLAKLRFYNVLPRQIALIMQQATQPFEANAQNINQGVGHSGQGITLTYGGARTLVVQLQRQLDQDGVAYVHVGDDSWVIEKVNATEMRMYALDGSNFDLTQHAAATKEVHVALREQLRLYDRVSAELWYEYARERLVVVVGQMVRLWKHAGPSGMPLQSKVNDVLMEVLIARILQRMRGRDLDESAVDALLMEEGRNLGFELRVEQYWRGKARTLLDALEQSPFLFIGYYFHVRDGELHVCADLPRTFAQVPYPTQKWAKDKGELQVVEAMRLGSIAMNLGIPPVEAQRAVDAFREGAIALIGRALKLPGADAENPKLRWAVQAAPWAEIPVPSLVGLKLALERPPESLWVWPKTGQPKPQVEPKSWADIAEDEDAERAAELNAALWRPANLVGSVQVPAVPLRVGVATTHPVTSANDGRPPPTAVWQPDRRPRADRGVGGPSRRKGGLRRTADFAGYDSESELWSQLDDTDDFDEFFREAESDDVSERDVW